MNEIIYSDFQNICRLCMLSCDIKFPQDKVISDIFYKLTDIHFEINDELPQQICLKCFDKMNEIQEFAFKCKRTHVILLKCIKTFKDALMYKEQETFEGINEPLKTEEQIRKDEVLSSLKLKENINVDKNNELEGNMIPETSVDQNIDCFKEDLLKQNTLNIKVANEEESTHNVNKNGGRPHKCEQCSKVFKQSIHLKDHIRTHSGERPYKCEQCLKSFTKLCNLKSHVRTHSAECPYKCKECSKSFSHFSNLKRHMRTHSGERPYKCEQCLKSFIRSADLKIHMRIHNGERPYKCEQCLKSFSQSSSLKIHMRTHSC